MKKSTYVGSQEELPLWGLSWKDLVRLFLYKLLVFWFFEINQGKNQALIQLSEKLRAWLGIQVLFLLSILILISIIRIHIAQIRRMIRWWRASCRRISIWRWWLSGKAFYLLWFWVGKKVDFLLLCIQRVFLQRGRMVMFLGI